MPSISEEELYARPRTLEDLLPALGMTTVPLEKRAEQGQKTLMEIASMLPVVGNAISAYDATETGGNAWNNLAAGNYKAGAIDAGLTGLNAIGAVLGLPIGKTAKEVAKAGKDTANVFVPAVMDATSDRAKDMRLSGKSPRDIWAETGRFFGPEGRLRENISDAGMAFKPGLEPYTTQSLGDVISHPELFDQFPTLAKSRVALKGPLRDRVGDAARTTADGTFELPLNASKGDVAKLLQYTIADQHGFSPALRHGTDKLRAQLAGTIERAAGANHETPKDLAALAAYIERINSTGSNFEDLLTRQGMSAAEKRTQQRIAGNADAKRVRYMANTEGAESVYPYGTSPNFWPKAQKQRPQPWDSIVPIIPENLDSEGVRQFLARWHTYGSGRPTPK